ncbi:uncharacterized protein F58A4.6 [Palaemon carinicauda]|uniref:uncharacterized protein F58A4.6 n=1 Tax=Palaemon carinicauda TaxID=392227 RepID=UPI0035B5A1D5
MADSSGSDDQSECVLWGFCNRQGAVYPTANGSFSFLVIVQYGRTFWDMMTLTPAYIESHCSQSRLFQRTHVFDQQNSLNWKEVLVALKSEKFKKKKCVNSVGISSKAVVLKNEMEGLHFCVFLKELMCSNTYRHLIVNRFSKLVERRSVRQRNIFILQWCLLDNLPQIIDYEWNGRMTRSAIERLHLDTAMSWLSTLGGACSALGDNDVEFAEKAGQISFQQMDLALRIGDPAMVSRCRLYLSISFIQQCRFKVASAVIRHEYYWAHSFPKEMRDRRLINMCHGIWKKLQYEKKKSNRNGHVRR